MPQVLSGGIASSIRVPLPPSSVHLLLNAPVGVLLGWRAGLAIPIGLTLQALLLAHGGYLVLGVNSCVMSLPALLAWQLFSFCSRLVCARTALFRGLLVSLSTAGWIVCLVYVFFLTAPDLARLPGLGWILSRLPPGTPDSAWAARSVFHPAPLTAVVGLAALAVWAERRLGNDSEFALGLFVGQVAVLATLFLNATALAWGGAEDFGAFAKVVFLAHLPVALVESTFLGFTVAFLARVKPEMLVASERSKNMPCAGEVVP